MPPSPGSLLATVVVSVNTSPVRHLTPPAPVAVSGLQEKQQRQVVLWWRVVSPTVSFSGAEQRRCSQQPVRVPKGVF